MELTKKELLNSIKIWASKVNIGKHITKTLVKVIKDDVNIATGLIQRVGLPGAREAAIKTTEEAEKLSSYLMQNPHSITFPTAKP